MSNLHHLSGSPFHFYWPFSTLNILWMVTGKLVNDLFIKHMQWHHLMADICSALVGYDWLQDASSFLTADFLNT